MKSKFALFAAGLLTVSLLAGCAAAPAAPETTMIPVVETAIPETIASLVTEPATEPAAEATRPVSQLVSSYEATITPVTTQPQTQVTVTTTDEFLAAIASDMEIIVDAPMIDLSTATGYGKTSGQNYQWREEYDGPGLYIVGVSNLTIRGNGENHGVNVISCDPRYANVLTFENCSNIHVNNFTAGHSKEPGYCMGGVLAFHNSQDILVEDCGLFGCGTKGVDGLSSKNIQVVNNEIYECSVSGVEFTECMDVNVDGNTFRDIGDVWDGVWMPGSIFRIYTSQNITYNGQDAVPFLTIEEMEEHYGNT